MAKVEKAITISASVEKIFGYLREPTNLPEIWPSLVEVKDVRRLPNGGNSDRWVYKMLGIRFEGTSETIEYLANQRTVSKNKGGIGSIITWTFQPEAGGTKVTFNAEYTVPIPLLGKLAEALIVMTSTISSPACLLWKWLIASSVQVPRTVNVAVSPASMLRGLLRLALPRRYLCSSHSIFPDKELIVISRGKVFLYWKVIENVRDVSLYCGSPTMVGGSSPAPFVPSPPIKSLAISFISGGMNNSKRLFW